ncbi:hypothetical protein jhhlp_005124 [Lomentospora prolificans]|uniref:Methyltransferase domain-containing protein n=1 Tax=Lomentospora prolificans TaxID=41688 RepID=A0A2N3N7J8_9PEZI|nr:hypothetical protein jhhlp_005124 [Lomentospora prolificans]
MRQWILESHHVHTLTLDGKLYLAPIKDDIQNEDPDAKVSQKVVDIGTGTGLWAIDFADNFPSCEVIGTDISPIQPTWVPPNVKFPNSVDFFHMRYMTGSLSVQGWFDLFKEAFRCTKPGGYFESFDAAPWFDSDDGTVTEKSALAQWGKLFVEGGKKIGRTFTMVDDGTQRKGMEEAGYVEIEERNFKVPMGKWPKDPKLKQLGIYAYAAVAADIEGYVLYMANLQGWTKEEVAVYAAHLRREMNNPAIHGYYRVKVVWGKKPE